ncbi:MAG: SMC-Scp complex subunit ScpB [Clostridiales bacterium]
MLEPLFSEEIKKAVEALIFVAGEPLTVGELAEYTEIKEEAVLEILWALEDEYKNKGFFLTEIAGGWQFMTKPQYYPYVERLYKPKLQRLSNAALETLAIIAYCQPITRGEIEEIRGVNADGIVSGLLEKGFVDEVGRKETPGKPILYGTNSKFLELLGLKSLEDLPVIELDRDKDSVDLYNAEKSTEIDNKKDDISLFPHVDGEQVEENLNKLDGVDENLNKLDEEETINEV